MAKVVCEYCGHYIEDIEERCPNCGAPNKDHKRVVDGTPKTIEQLKSWYKARNLPPEETTRFFIGKDIKEPRAFGIYEENGRYIVYKNKSDGSRAVRYEGTDEAYAVNELYLRLKEEILNQKNNNLKKKARIRTNNGSRGKRRGPLRTLTIFFCCFFIYTAVCLGLMYSNDFFSNDYSSSYYLTEAGDIYYNNGYRSYGVTVDRLGYEWWSFNEDAEEWSYFDTYDTQKELPPGVEDGKSYDYVGGLAEATGISQEKLRIWNSRNFIDAGNHMTPSTSYYYYNGSLYYFLDDYNSYYGNTDNTGWYIYNNDTWEYYCDEDDKTTLGEDLWYSDDEYYVGRDINDIYSYNDSLSTSWMPSDFEDTSWYESYEANNDAYDDYQATHHYNDDDDDDYDWSSDSDWDWDSSDSWDSGGTDWDSDW